MMTRVKQVVVALTLGTTMITAACGGDDGGGTPDAHVNPPATDGGGVDAIGDPPIPDAATPDAATADAEVPDAEPPPGDGVISNLPIPVEATSASQQGLVLLSSNFGQESIGSSVFNHWYAEVENRGSSTVCFVHILVDLRDSAGTSLVTLESYADGPAYKSSGTVSTSCLAPGEHGGFWDFNSASALVPLDQARRATYTIDSFTPQSIAPHPLAPTIESATVIPRFNGFALSGTVRGVGTIYNLGMSAYTIGANGLVSDEVSDTNLDTLLAGGTWAYETSANDGTPVARQLQFIDFIEGAHPKLAPAEPHARALQTFHDKRVQARSRRDALAAVK